VEDLFRRVAEYETGKGAAYFLSLRWWTAMFGESELGLRLPSAILGSLASVAGALWAALLAQTLAHTGEERAVSRRRVLLVAGVAGVVLSLHPTLVMLGREARSYAFSHFFLLLSALLSVHAYLQAESRWTRGARIACPVTAALGASAHLFSLAFLIGVVLATGAAMRARRCRFGPLAIGAAAFAVLLLTQAPLTLGHVKTTYLGGETLPTVGPRDVIHYALDVFGGKPGVFVVGTLALWSFAFGRRDPVVRFGLVAALVAAVIAALGEAMVPTLALGGARYLVWGAFLIPVLLAGLSGLRREHGAIAMLALAGALAVSLVRRHDFEDRYREDWRAASRAMESVESHAVQILCHRGMVVRPLRHYYRGSSPLHSCRFVGSPESPCDCIDTARDAIRGGRAAFLVWSHAEPWESRREEFEAALGPATVVHEQYAIRVLRFGP